MPFDREAVGLLLAESYQAAGRSQDAIEVVDALPRSPHTIVSTAELYMQTGRTDDVVRITDGLTGSDDGAMFALIMRARALREQGQSGAALQCLNDVKTRSLSRLVAHKAWFERGLAHEAEDNLVWRVETSNACSPKIRLTTV